MDNNNPQNNLLPESIRQKIAERQAQAAQTPITQPTSPTPPPPVASPLIQQKPKRRFPLWEFLAGFVVSIGWFLWVGQQVPGTLNDHKYLIGGAIISLGVAIVTAIVGWIIRKIAARFGTIWFVILWGIIVLAIAIAGWIIFHPAGYKVDHNPNGFLKKSFYKEAPADWNVYINKDFDLSLRYPPTAEIDEGPSAYGFNDLFALHLTSTSTEAAWNIIIYSTPSTTLCTDLVKNTDIPAELYKYKKTINGKEYKVAVEDLISIYGLIHRFQYWQETPICKVIQGSYIVPITKDGKAVTDKINYPPFFDFMESIIGSMESDVENAHIDPSQVMNAYESKYALGLISQDAYFLKDDGARFFNDKKTYTGFCDVMRKTGNLNIVSGKETTCKESAKAFVAYVYVGPKIHYICVDPTGAYQPVVEPTGLSCSNTPPAKPQTQTKTTSATTANTTAGSTVNSSGQIDCGTKTYTSYDNLRADIKNQACLSNAIKTCSSAYIFLKSPTVEATYLVQKEGNSCYLSSGFNTPGAGGGGGVKCLVTNPSKGWDGVDGNQCTNL